MSTTKILYDAPNEKLTANIEINNIDENLSDFVISNINAVTDRYHVLVGIITDICKLWENEEHDIVCKNNVPEAPSITVEITFPGKDLTVKILCGSEIDRIEISATKTSVGVYLGFFKIYVIREAAPNLVSHIVEPPNSHRDIQYEFTTCLQEYCKNYKIEITEFKEPKPNEE